MHVSSVILDPFGKELGAESKHTHASLTERYVIQGGIVEEAHNLGLPEVEGIMSEDYFLVQQINDTDTVCVDVNGLV